MDRTRTAANLPEPQATAFQYAPVSLQGRIAFLAGQIAKGPDGELLSTGKCGRELSLEEARRSCVLAVDQALAWINRELGGLANVERILRMQVFIAATEDFDGLSNVADAGTGRLIEFLGDAAGRCPRSVIGVVRLPRDAPVLVELTISLCREVAQ